MALNIKNERVHALAREVAQRTGRTQTSAIEFALERLLANLGDSSAAIARRQRIEHVQDLAVNADLDAEDLYDEAGLPR
ncbi:type II toxin-antitoxin system VapB family antitoxin [Aeromicrobium sp. HA]|uniref:type II toxin-antitoxin system VapB family antitoxin n=1 Tax=Aeromicrobium sp. HA TaxID=3009077 RepID=UPI0022B02404|nr:type II toxin-antitoxin system VapB family antitoxin [Aeromicrobium sp. HA]